MEFWQGLDLVKFLLSRALHIRVKRKERHFCRAFEFRGKQLPGTLHSNIELIAGFDDQHGFSTDVNDFRV